VRVIAWLNLVGNLAIIATGGAVRLTESGLGCPTWPQCTPDSWVPTADLGGHALIEFGNRLMSPILAILAILAVLSVWRFRKARPDLWAHAWIIAGGIVVQAVVGGVTVWTGLNAWIVGTHYIASAILVGVATSMVLRTRRERGPRALAVPAWLFGMTHIATLLFAALIVAGVVTTGNGPHSGDPGVVREGIAWDVLAHVHAWIGYALVAALVVLLVGAIAHGNRRYRNAVLAVTAIVAIQVVVGIAQSRLGIPPLLVGIHMVLAGVSVALMVVLVDATKRPSPTPRGADFPADTPS